MDYREIIDDVLDLSSQSGGDDFEDMVKAAINRTYRRMLDLINQDNERREFSLTTVANTSKYGMPLYVKHVINIEDATNNRRIYDISTSEFDATYPGTSEAGDPRKAYRLGTYGVQAQPSSAGTVQIVSSSNSDLGANYNVRVTGFVSDVLRTETIELNGTTAKAGLLSFAANGIERVVKRAAAGVSWSGYLTLSDGTTTFATLPIWWDSPSYLWYEFWPTPDAARTYTVRAIMRKPDLLNDEDWPEIDEDFHNVIVWGAAAEVLPSIGKQGHSDRFRLDYETGLGEFEGSQQVEHNRTRVFADVTTEPNVSMRPRIKGVDYV